LLICQSALIGKLLRRFDSGKSNSLIAHLVLDEDEALIERHVLDGHRLDSAHLGRISSILAHEDVVNHIDALLVGDIVVGLHKSSTHGEALLHGLHIEVVTSLDESRLVRDSSVGSISSDILPVNKVLSPSLPLLLTSDGASSEGSVASGGIGKAGALVTSKREVRLEEGGLVRDSRVSGISPAIFPIDEVLGPSLPLLLASDGAGSEGLVTSGGIGETRALIGSEIELSLNKSRGIGDSGVSVIGLVISKVDEILGPSLPLLLASDSASSEGLVTSGGIGETRALIGSEIELSSNESGSIRLSFVGDISAPFSPIVEVLSPILPSLLASRVIMRLISVGLSRKARATLLASKIELLLSKS
jgi:DNA-directed RNA polymerase subunit H (RpoH/RPB5)